MRVVVVGSAAGDVARDLPRIRDYSQISAEVDGGGVITLTLTS
jgi:hypothetical protein